MPGARELRLAPLTRPHALDVCSWRYPPPDDRYDMAGVDPDHLLDPAAGFFAVLAGDRLVGFRSFGPDGRVPGWTYDDSALDTGGGLRPSLVGHGLGRPALAAGLAFARSRYAPLAFRVTVAAVNARALRTVEALGFARTGGFPGSAGREFVVLVRPEP